ncbi:MAG: glycoside hydrolase family 13 [Gemmatimonadales bacterium]
MPAERDDEIRDPTLRRAVAELRQPLVLDPEVERGALSRIQAGGSARRRVRLGWLGAALAAGIACLLLARSSAPIHPPTVSATRPVLLRLAAPASRVAVVGDFNDWDPAATPLRRTDDGAIWTVELHLKPGRYHYTFLIDGRRWAGDPAGPRAVESDFGAPVSVLTVS